MTFDPDRDLPRPVSVSFFTDEEVEAKIVEIEASHPGVPRSTIVHRIVRRALVGAPETASR